MTLRKLKTSVAAFTLIEIIIASAVFSLFVTGAFSFYRMGSRMFVSGSWKIQKQKETERFLLILKERIEQASNATMIDPAVGEASIASAPCNFLALENDTVVENIGANVRKIMMFTVCKPDMTRIGGSNGMILHHSLVAVPAEKNLYTLHLHANTVLTPHGGVDYFNTAQPFGPIIPAPPHPTQQLTDLTNFNGLPIVFGFGSAPQTHRLGDVRSARVIFQQASDGGSDSNEKVIGLQLRLQNPNHDQTFLEHSFQAKVDFAVPVRTYALPGGF